MNDLSPTVLLTQQLIACASVTPVDAGCQNILAERLQQCGFRIEHLRFGDVDNLWAVRGQGRPTLVFAGHTDVVPPGDLAQWEMPPFSPSIRDGFLFGRGAADMKGGLAAMMTAVERFVKQYPDHRGAIAFLITSDEEGIAENGTLKVIEYLQSQTPPFPMDYCLVGEPTSREHLGDTIKPGCRGSLNGTLKIQGKQGHIAYPDQAKNPNHAALAPLAEVAALHWDEPVPHFPPTGFQYSNIQAGTGATNVIPNELSCTFNWRFSPASTPDSLLTQMKDVLKRYPLQYTLDWHVSGQPFISHYGPLTTACEQAILEILHLQSHLWTGGGTSDARFIAPLGTEVIEFGLCNSSIHAINECVRIADLDALSKIYERILSTLLLEQRR